MHSGQHTSAVVGSLVQRLLSHSNTRFVVHFRTASWCSMAAADAVVPSGSAPEDDDEPLVAPQAAASDETGSRVKRRQRIVRPRIDIDDQIREANRVSDLLKRMGQAAKTLKKTQTKAKQRLVKKAARLSPQDLERIAVLKRVFGDPDTPSDDASSSCSSLQSSSPPAAMGITAMHNTLKTMMKGVSGADDVVAGLGIRYTQDDKRGSALTKEHSASDKSDVEQMASSTKGVKRLASLKRLPSMASDAKRRETDDAHESPQIDA